MKVKKLYGIVNLDTLELVPMYTSKGNRYAYTRAGYCHSRLTMDYPDKYQIVELVPNMELHKCQEQ